MRELTPNDKRAFSALAGWWGARLQGAEESKNLTGAFADKAVKDTIHPEQRQIFVMTLASMMGVEYQQGDPFATISCGTDKMPDSILRTALSYAGLPDETPLPRHTSTSMEKQDTGLWHITLSQGGQKTPIAYESLPDARIATSGRYHLKLA